MRNSDVGVRSQESRRCSSISQQNTVFEAKPSCWAHETAEFEPLELPRPPAGERSEMFLFIGKGRNALLCADSVLALTERSSKLIESSQIVDILVHSTTWLAPANVVVTSFSLLLLGAVNVSAVSPFDRCLDLSVFACSVLPSSKRSSWLRCEVEPASVLETEPWHVGYVLILSWHVYWFPSKHLHYPPVENVTTRYKKYHYVKRLGRRKVGKAERQAEESKRRRELTGTRRYVRISH